MSEDYARSYELVQSEKMAYNQILQLLQEQNYHNFHIPEMDAIESITDNTTFISAEQYLQKGLHQYSLMNDTKKNYRHNLKCR